MWNILFKKAYDDGCDYFYQCGDDINFKTVGWVKDCIKKLNENNDIGTVGPINNDGRILTQTMVSRKHMDIFGWYFPEEIINWCCDDWINLVYKPKYLYKLNKHYCSNDGGNPRYVINNDKTFVKSISEKVRLLRDSTALLAYKHKILIEQFIQQDRK